MSDAVRKTVEYLNGRLTLEEFQQKGKTMSELMLNVPTESKAMANAYFDGAAAAIRLYATWKDGTQWVGMGRPLGNALQDNENRRQEILESI